MLFLGPTAEHLLFWLLLLFLVSYGMSDLLHVSKATASNNSDKIICMYDVLTSSYLPAFHVSPEVMAQSCHRVFQNPKPFRLALSSGEVVLVLGTLFSSLRLFS